MSAAAGAQRRRLFQARKDAEGPGGGAPLGLTGFMTLFSIVAVAVTTVASGAESVVNDFRNARTRRRGSGRGSRLRRRRSGAFPPASRLPWTMPTRLARPVDAHALLVILPALGVGASREVEVPMAQLRGVVLGTRLSPACALGALRRRDDVERGGGELPAADHRHLSGRHLLTTTWCRREPLDLATPTTGPSPRRTEPVEHEHTCL